MNIFGALTVFDWSAGIRPQSAQSGWGGLGLLTPPNNTYNTGTSISPTTPQGLLAPLI